jgi:hypothetical protein
MVASHWMGTLHILLRCNLSYSFHLGKSMDDVTSDDRDQTKRIVYGILYGMGTFVFSFMLGCALNIDLT